MNKINLIQVLYAAMGLLSALVFGLTAFIVYDYNKQITKNDVQIRELQQSNTRLKLELVDEHHNQTHVNTNDEMNESYKMLKLSKASEENLGLICSFTIYSLWSS